MHRRAACWGDYPGHARLVCPTAPHLPHFLGFGTTVSIATAFPRAMTTMGPSVANDFTREARSRRKRRTGIRRSGMVYTYTVAGRAARW